MCKQKWGSQRERGPQGITGDELWGHMEFEVPVEHSDGDFQVGNMELGQGVGAQETVPMSQSICVSAEVSKEKTGWASFKR